MWQQVGHVALLVLDEVRLAVREPLVVQHLFRRGSFRRVNREAGSYKVLGGLGNILPVLLCLPVR